MPRFPKPLRGWGKPPWSGGEAQAGYSCLQIGLHWLVAGLVAVQWLTFDAIHRTHGGMLPPKPSDLLEHAVHIYSGIAIGALMAMRLLLRLWRGAPRRVTGGWTGKAARTVHAAFHLALFSQVATGFAASYLWGGAGRFHVVIRKAILVLLALHMAATLLHLLLRDGAVSAMSPFPGRRDVER